MSVIPLLGASVEMFTSRSEYRCNVWNFSFQFLPCSARARARTHTHTHTHTHTRTHTSTHTHNHTHAHTHTHTHTHTSTHTHTHTELSTHEAGANCKSPGRLENHVTSTVDRDKCSNKASGPVPDERHVPLANPQRLRSFWQPKYSFGILVTLKDLRQVI